MQTDNEKKTMKCFVILPSGTKGEYDGGKEESDYVYSAIIEPAVKEVYGNDIKVKREVDGLKAGPIDRNIVTNIAVSDIAIVDVTGLNPNVFLELGMRYALRKNTTILLSQENTTLPFDVASHRCIIYSQKYSRANIAKEKLKSMLLESAQQGISYSDNLVYNTFPDLRVDLGNSPEKKYGVMPWEYYWLHFAQIVQRLTVSQRIAFNPDVVLGISNGGMMFADLLVRNTFKGVPIWSLWANRNAESGAAVFNNEPNNTLLENIIRWLETKKNKSSTNQVDSSNKPTILLIDDIVSTGATSMEAFNYLGSFSATMDMRFLPMFNNNPDSFERIKKFLIWSFPPYNYEREEVEKIHATDYVKLPYLKDLR